MGYLWIFYIPIKIGCFWKSIAPLLFFSGPRTPIQVETSRRFQATADFAPPIPPWAAPRRWCESINLCLSMSILYILHIYIYTYIYICNIYIYMQYMYIYICNCISIYIYMQYVYVYIYAIYIYIYAIYVYIYICNCISIYIYAICICIYICNIYIYMQLHIYIYKYIYIYTKIYIYMYVWNSNEIHMELNEITMNRLEWYLVKQHIIQMVGIYACSSPELGRYNRPIPIFESEKSMMSIWTILENYHRHNLTLHVFFFEWQTAFRYNFDTWNQTSTQRFWLVVGPPLWKIWFRQLGWWDSQFLGTFQKWQPNHQPGMFKSR